jgi:hypothetical protein
VGKTYDVNLILAGPAGKTSVTGKVQVSKTKPKDIARDTFTGTPGTRLAAHAPDVGGPWVEAEEAWEIRDGVARDTDVGFGKGLAVLNAAQPDVTVQCRLTRLSAGNNPRAGLVLRYAGPGNFLILFFDGARLLLHKYEDHIATPLAVVGYTIADGRAVRLQATLCGDAVTAYIDGEQVLSASGVMEHQSATYFGLYYANESNGGVAWQFDNFAVSPFEF